MLKPTKKINTSNKDGTSSLIRTEDNSAAANRPRNQVSDLPGNVSGPDAGRRASTEHPFQHPPQSEIIVTEIPGSVRPATPPIVKSALNMIMWPQDRVGERMPFGRNTGLFVVTDGTLIADIKGLGKTVVERTSQGEYQVPFPFAPGVPGPILARIAGEPYWYIERPGWVKKPVQTPLDTSAQPFKFLLPELANLLEPASPLDGIRHDKLGRTYADIDGEGTVLIRKNDDGDYQASDVNERVASGPLVERIPGTVLWRRIPERPPSPESPRLYIHESPDMDADTAATQVKRPRLEQAGESSDPMEASNTAQLFPQTTVESPYHWMQWVHYNDLPTGPSVKLGGFDYTVLPPGSAPDELAGMNFLQNPDSPISRFDDFERVMREAPELQPVAVFPKSNHSMEVPPAHKLFRKPLSRSVAERFTEFSEGTALSVAKTLFERADNSPQITSTGLNNIRQVLAHWSLNPKATSGVPLLGDPMLMLHEAPRIERNGTTYLTLNAQAEAPLHRLNFDPKLFPEDWNFYLRSPSSKALRQLTGGLLVRAGYDVFRLTPQHQPPTLVFRSLATADVFILKLAAVEGNGITLYTYPGTELFDPLLPACIGKPAYDAVVAADAKNQLIWLLGGVLNVDSKPDSVFIIRER